MKNIRNQVIETLEYWLQQASEAVFPDQEDIGNISGMLEYVRNDQSTQYYIRDAHLLREVLQSLDLNRKHIPPGGCSLTQVYEYLDPIVKDWEFKAEKLEDENQIEFEY